MLKSTGVGCYSGLNFCGARSYRHTDDLILISPSATSKKDMLSICKSFAKEYQKLIKFNANKSQVFLFKGKYHISGTVSFKVNEQVIEYASPVKHLGHKLATDTPGLVNGNNIATAFNKLLIRFLLILVI